MDSFKNMKSTYENLPDAFYSKVELTPVKDPELLIFNRQLAKELGLDEELLRSEEGISVLSGNRSANGEYAVSQAYAGHQFGHFTILGDGRAILVGEQLTPSGEIYDLQLKGSGRTPYSRGGDGRATLSSMLREYLISEGMHGLGIPTSRSLAVVRTGERVRRERDYPGGILTRVAKSHLRVGTFQYAATRGSTEDLKELVDYALYRHDRQCLEETSPYQCFFKGVVKRQAELIAQWQSLGFIHGVMNTDNMTISGETIDYGPCAFMDEYRENTVFSSIDHYGRYAYGNQPKIGGWNLARLAEALLSLFDDDREKSISFAEQTLEEYGDQYHDAWMEKMAGKIGFSGTGEKQRRLITDLLDLMEQEHLDFTNTFLGLLEELMVEHGHNMKRIHGFSESSGVRKWISHWKEELQKSGGAPEEIIRTMRERNPRYIPRNHLVEEVLKEYGEKGKDTAFNELLIRIRDPYNHDRERTEQDEIYQRPGPKDGIPYKTYCGT